VEDPSCRATRQSAVAGPIVGVEGGVQIALTKIGPQSLDYSRPENISDHDYVRNLLRKSIEELSSDPPLPNDDGSDCDEAIAEYLAHRASLN